MKLCCFRYISHAWYCLWKFANQNTPKTDPQSRRRERELISNQQERAPCGGVWGFGGALEARWWVHRPGRSRIRWKPHISSSQNLLFICQQLAAGRGVTVVSLGLLIQQPPPLFSSLGMPRPWSFAPPEAHSCIAGIFAREARQFI